MCGICGKFIFSGASVNPELIEKMRKKLNHRGPDDHRVYTDNFIGLAQARLAIIDIRPEGTAPLSNEDKTIWVTFNGEIYNYKELQRKLKDKGHIFRTNTDTEVLVHLYEEEGFSMVESLRGMFAFALWDSKNKILFAARDRLGEKPFVYHKSGTSFTFASEIKSLLEDSEISISPDFNAIDSYLTNQYVPSPQTAFEKINKLPPGHLLICDSKGDMKIRSYWQPELKSKLSLNKEEIKERLLNELREAVRIRMIADVPLGTMLSGGIDSCSVAALMAQESDRPIKTFSIGLEGFPSKNELPYAKLVAERYSTDHHEYVIDPKAIDILPWLIDQFDEPFADYSAIPTYYVSKLARQHVTVALSGDGGDESFAGYRIYGKMERWSKIDKIPYPGRKVLFTPLRKLTSLFPDNNKLSKLNRILRMLEGPVPERFNTYRSILKKEEKKIGYTNEFYELSQNIKDKMDRTIIWNENINLYDWLMLNDQSKYLPECLNVKVDITSMACSLEVRTPFLDHKLVEFAATIPSEYKRVKNNGKIILKETMAPFLPKEIISKPKTGFSIPLKEWLKSDLKELMYNCLLDEKADQRNLFTRQFRRKLVEEHLYGKRDWTHRIWALICLELWFRKHID